jgi:hypothetical protein
MAIPLRVNTEFAEVEHRAHIDDVLSRLRPRVPAFFAELTEILGADSQKWLSHG